MGWCAIVKTHRAAKRQAGVALVLMMFALALMAIASLRVMTWVSVQAQRDAEEELAFIGEQFVNAIRSYYLSPSGTRNELPPSVDSLLMDHRKLVVTRHLRRLPVDPLTGKSQWGIVHGRLLSSPYGLDDSALMAGPPVEGIVGIHSLSTKNPIRTTDGTGTAISSYADWVIAVPATIVRTDAK